LKSTTSAKTAMTPDDGDLLAAVGEGSDRAFNQLIDRHQQALRNFLRRLTSGIEDADDIAQETFLTVWKTANAWRGGSVKSWIFAIAWRKAKDAQRRGFRRQARDAAWLDAGDGGAGPAADDRLALDQALSVLTLDQKAAVMLCIGCGFTHNEAAETLGQPLGTVKSHVLRGRARLIEVFGDGV
jgi:RNA polymerase sigma factor (sigma-70 family)